MKSGEVLGDWGESPCQFDIKEKRGNPNNCKAVSLTLSRAVVRNVRGWSGAVREPRAALSVPGRV